MIASIAPGPATLSVESDGFALEMRPLDSPGLGGWRIDYTDSDLGASGQIDHWVVGDRLYGRVEIGEHRATWRVPTQETHRAERWRASGVASTLELAALRRARKLVVEALLGEACSDELALAEFGLGMAIRGVARGAGGGRVILGCD